MTNKFTYIEVGPDNRVLSSTVTTSPLESVPEGYVDASQQASDLGVFNLRGALFTNNQLTLDEAYYAQFEPPVAQNVPQPPPPPADRWITLLQFRNRFTQEEKVAIYTAAETNVLIRVWLDDLAAVQNNEVNLDDPQTVAGVQQLETAGLIGPNRSYEILELPIPAPEPAPAPAPEPAPEPAPAPAPEPAPEPAPAPEPPPGP